MIGAESKQEHETGSTERVTSREKRQEDDKEPRRNRQGMIDRADRNSFCFCLCQSIDRSMDCCPATRCTHRGGSDRAHQSISSIGQSALKCDEPTPTHPRQEVPFTRLSDPPTQSTDGPNPQQQPANQPVSQPRLPPYVGDVAGRLKPLLRCLRIIPTAAVRCLLLGRRMAGGGRPQGAHKDSITKSNPSVEERRLVGCGWMGCSAGLGLVAAAGNPPLFSLGPIHLMDRRNTLDTRHTSLTPAA